MHACELPVSPEDSMIECTPDSSRLSLAIRIGMFCVLMLLGLATPARVDASPASSLRDTSSSPAAAPDDNDGDGIPDDSDPDDDNDSVADATDVDPFNAAPPPAETPDIIAPDQDTDNDGIDNIMDPDDDNDAVEDDEDPAPFTPVPPAEIPEAPEAEVPAPEQPDAAGVAEPVRPEIDAPGPIASQSRPEANAPLVVALPSTGSGGTAYTGFPLSAFLSTLALVSGTTALMLRGRAAQSIGQR